MLTGKVFDLGRRGDGLLMHDGRKVFIADVLPGETVAYEMADDMRACVQEIISPSPDRQKPVCPFFAQCGGCTLQHLKPEAYRAFKLRYLKELFPAHWDMPEFDEPVFIAPQTRRRVTFAVAWNGPARWFGLNPGQSDKVLAVTSCAVLVPGLEKLIAPLRAFICSKDRSFGKKRGTGDVSVLMTDCGADVLITLPFEPDFGWRQAAAGLASSAGLARISWRYSERAGSEPLAVLRPPVLAMGDFLLKPPPGVFLQPSEEGEKALADAVIDYAGNARRIIDLFCGAGTFTLPLLKKKRVLKGADNASEALKALEAASAGRVKTENRDLFKTPLWTDELEEFDAVVFDPPRAGARAQCEQIAASDVRRVIAVSCNPASFVRDAEILMNGGYTMKRIRPVDQFVFTPHLELVALFEK